MNPTIFVKMVLDAWHLKIKEANDIFNRVSDEQLLQEVAPNRNRGIYLLGHYTATHDAMLPLLGFGERIYAHLDDAFHDNPDRVKPITVSAPDLRAGWKNINAVLEDHFNKMSPEMWFTKHKAISEEDFKNQPHRNKLNVIITRTNHLAYHNGQLIFLLK
ncbi:MAG: DinB family protein [Bacteroidia bacterium]|nr:DinB family protein [Bacteroidia bacterium]